MAPQPAEDFVMDGGGCRSVYAQALSRKDSGQSAIVGLKSMLQVLKADDHYKVLEDVRGEPFSTWEQFVQYREPFGLGMRPEVVDAILTEPDAIRLLAVGIEQPPPLNAALLAWEQLTPGDRRAFLSEIVEGDRTLNDVSEHETKMNGT